MRTLLLILLFSSTAFGQRVLKSNGKTMKSGGKVLIIPTVVPTPVPDDGGVTPPPPDDVAVPAEPMATTTYYFSPTGSNSRTATEAQNPATPWRDFGAIQTLNVPAGTHFVLADGEYGPSQTAYQGMPMALYPNSDRGWIGTEGSPIVVKAAPGATPVLTTLQTALNPVAVAGYPNVFAYAINSIDELASVRIDNRYRGVTRWPKRTETGDRGYLMGRTQTGGNQGSTATITGITIPAANIVGADIFTRNNEYIHFAHPITAKTSTSVSFLNMGFAPIEQGFGTYYTNHISFLSADGEWAVKSSQGGTDTLYVYFSDGQPFNHTVRYAHSNHVMWSLNARHVQFRGITFEGSSSNLVRLQNVQDNKFYNCHFRGAGRGAIFQVNGAPRTEIIGGTVKHCNTGAFDLGTEANTIIEGTTIDSISLFEVRPNFNIEYQNGTLTRVFFDAFWGDAAIVAGGNNSRIRFNSMTNLGQNGINWNGANTVVHGNFLQNVVLRKTDAAAIYSYQKGLPNFTEAQTRTITNNIIINVPGDPGGTANVNYSPVFGVYNDDEVDRVNIKRNTISGAVRGAFYNHHTQYINIDTNNVINSEYGYYTRYGDNSSTKLPVDNFMRGNTVVSTQSHQIDSSLTVVQQGVFASLQPSQTATFSNNAYFAWSSTREHLLLYNASTATAAIPYTGTDWLNIRTGVAIGASPVSIEAYRSIIAAKNGPVGSIRSTRTPQALTPPPPSTPTRKGEKIVTWTR